MKIVVYYRTRAEGRQKYGLDLASQESDVQDFIKRHRCKVLKSFTGIEQYQRPYTELIQAIEYAKNHQATLVIGTVYKMRVNLKMMTLLKGVDFITADEETMNTQTWAKEYNIAKDWSIQKVQIIRDGVSRSKKTKKAGSTRPGHWHEGNEHLRQSALKKATKKAAEVRADRVERAYAPVKDLILQLKEKGETYQRIADRLNNDGFLTTTGGPFTTSSIHRLLKGWSNDQ